MNITIIGYGSMAKALAPKWAKRHPVIITGRNQEKARQLAAMAGASYATPAKGLQSAEVVVLATPADTVLDVVETMGGDAAFAGKVVIDMNNPIDITTFESVLEPGVSLTDKLAELLPSAHLAKAFNMSPASVWDMDELDFDGRRLTTLFAASELAVAATRELIEAAGSTALYMGGIEIAFQLEQAANLVINHLFNGAHKESVLNFVHP